MFSQVVKYAKEIRDNKLENKKWIYVDDKLKVHLVSKLPEEYWIKGDILTVYDPETYLYEINKREPTDKELGDFLWISDLYGKRVGVEYGEIVPKELIRTHLLTLPVEDIIRSRRTSKEFKDVIDDNYFWCEMMERDYKGQVYDKSKCLEEYQNKYKWKRSLYITQEQLRECANKVNHNISSIESVIKDIGLKKDVANNFWYLDPKMGSIRLTLFKDIQSKNPQNYIVLEETSENVDIYQCLKPLMKNIIHIEIIYDKYIKVYIRYIDYIKLYEKVYGKDSFDRDFITDATEFLTKERHARIFNIHIFERDFPNKYSADKYNKYNETPQEVLSKFRKLAK